MIHKVSFIPVLQVTRKKRKRKSHLQQPHHHHHQRGITKDVKVGDADQSHAVGHVPGLVIEIVGGVTEAGQDLVVVIVVAVAEGAPEAGNVTVVEIGIVTVTVTRSVVAASAVTAVTDIVKKPARYQLLPKRQMLRRIAVVLVVKEYQVLVTFPVPA